jgi:4-amino-4-deoxy-L-arabinose transferase-like glycosyltransferase
MTVASFLFSRRRMGAAAFLYGFLVALVFVFFVYSRQSLVDTTTTDLNGFGGIARTVARGEGFSIGYGPTVRRAPLYPLLGAALLTMAGSDTPGAPEAAVFRPLLVANCVIFGLTCLAVWSLASRIGLSGPTAALAVLICPVLPQSMRYVGMTEVETLMGLWTVLLALCSHALVARPTTLTGAALGVVAALATLSKPIVLLYPLAFLPFAFWYWSGVRVPRRDAIVGSLAMLVAFGLLLAPWTLRNWTATNGQYTGISSNGPGEFLRGYINAQSKYFLLRQDFGGGGSGEKWDPEANAFEEEFLSRHGLPFYRVGREPGGRFTLHPAPPAGVTSAMLEIEKDRVEGAEMTRRVLHEPVDFVRKFLVQVATFWYVVETRGKSLLVGGLALIVLAFSAGGALRARRAGAIVWPVLFVVVYFNGIYAVFLAFARYSMPLFPLLSVLTAGGVAALTELVFRKRLASPASRIGVHAAW